MRCAEIKLDIWENGEMMIRNKNVMTLVAAITALSFSTALALPAPVAAALQQQRTATPGTLMKVKLANTIGSDISQPGDPVDAILIEPMISGGEIVFPVGTKVRGIVKAVERPGRGQRNGSIEFVFNRLVTPDGQERSIVANLEGASKYTQDSWKRRLFTLAIAVGAGVLVSKIFGGSVARGLLLGGAAGTGYVIYKEGDDVRLPEGTTVNLVLEENASVDYDFPAQARQPAQPQQPDRPAEPQEPDYAAEPGSSIESDIMTGGPTTQVILRNGSAITGTFKGVTADGRIAIAQQYGDQRIPFTDVDQLIFDDSVDLSVERQNDDAILLLNGNVMRGYFKGFSGGRLVLATQYGENRVPVQDVARLVFGR